MKNSKKSTEDSSRICCVYFAQNFATSQRKLETQISLMARDSIREGFLECDKSLEEFVIDMNQVTHEFAKYSQVFQESYI